MECSDDRSFVLGITTPSPLPGGRVHRTGPLRANRWVQTARCRGIWRSVHGEPPHSTLIARSVAIRFLLLARS